MNLRRFNYGNFIFNDGCTSAHGKSTWVKKQLKENDYYVSRDEIRFSLLKEGEDYFSHENLVFTKFLQTIDEALRSCDRVFADATHLTPESRIKVINYVKNSADFINVIWMKTPLMECYRRNEQREGNAKVPKHVIKSMYDRLKLPTFKEGITDLYIIDDINKDIRVMMLIDNEENFIF